MAAANDYSQLEIVDVRKRESLPSPFFATPIQYVDWYVRLGPAKHYLVVDTQYPGGPNNRACFAYDWAEGKRGRFLPRRSNRLLRAALDAAITQHQGAQGDRTSAQG